MSDSPLETSTSNHSTPASTPPTAQRRIGITGGVSMGKTTISDYLASTYHLLILDADQLARLAVEPGSIVLTQIIERYGKSILQPDGTLDRRRLGDIIFHSLPERHWLEQQIHPFVRDRLQIEIQHHAQEPTIVLVIPLLFEARMTDLVTEIWVVRSSQEQQHERLMQRDRLTWEQATARINSQMSIDKKVHRAHVVLDNSLTREHLFQQIDRALLSPSLSAPSLLPSLDANVS